MANTDRLLGQVLGDTYRLKRRVASGTMGMIYEAEDLPRSRRVAVKLLHPSVSRDAMALERFQREAQEAGTLGHPHVAELFDFSPPEAKGAYIVTELLEGEDLAARLQRVRRLGVRAAVAITRDLLAALAAAHAAGVAHRDLKPNNVFLCKKGGRADHVKVTDFGLTSLWTAAGSVATTRPLGTARYFAPEQAQGSPAGASAAADLWAVGTILYEMLTGAPAFAGPDRGAITARIAGQEPTPLRTVRGEVRPELEAVVTRALAKAPGDRFASAAEMREALAAAARLSGDWDEAAAEALTLPPVSPATLAALTDPFADILTTPQDHGPDSFKDPFAVMRTVPLEKVPRVATKTFPPPLQPPTEAGTPKSLAEAANRATPPLPPEGALVAPVAHGTTEELTLDDIEVEESARVLIAPPPPPRQAAVSGELGGPVEPVPEAEFSQPTLAWWRNKLVLGSAGAGLLVLIVGAVLISRGCSGEPKVAERPKPPTAELSKPVVAAAPADAAAPTSAPAEMAVATPVQVDARPAAPAQVDAAPAVAAAPAQVDAAPAAPAPAPAVAAAAAPPPAPAAVAAEAPAPAEAAPEPASRPARRSAPAAAAKPARRPPPAREEKGLSRQKVRAAMAPLERAVKACFRNFNVTKGAATLSVTVEPSGRIARVATAGRHAGTPAGGCAASAARRAKFPAFAGKPVTISYSYDLR